MGGTESLDGPATDARFSVSAYSRRFLSFFTTDSRGSPFITPVALSLFTDRGSYFAPNLGHAKGIFGPTLMPSSFRLKPRPCDATTATECLTCDM